MTINEYLEATRKYNRHADMLSIRPAVECNDGFRVSVQASEYHYCTPRIDYGPYAEVELGYPSAEMPTLVEYAENEEKPLETVYGYVPVELVDALLESHGGIKEQE